MEKPDVELIEGLSPAISIDQKTTSKNPRSTVGTVTEIYDYIRLLYARIGIPYCPNCGKKIEKQTIDQIVDTIMELEQGTKIQVLAPIIRGRKGEFKKVLEDLTKEGFVRNDGTAPETAIVKVTIPAGTTFVEGSIAVEDSQETYELADLTTTGIELTLNPDESKTVEFKVTVQDLDNGTKIRNIATVDDEPTKETEHTYVEPKISQKKSAVTENKRCETNN